MSTLLPPVSGSAPVPVARAPAGLLGVVFVLLWSTGYPAARIALDHAAPFTVLVLRFGGAALIFGALIYFVPAMVAFGRWHRQRLAILTLNALSGWTFLGWIGSLVWACTNDVER